MKIKSNALPYEVNSPFFIANKMFCEEVESFVKDKHGNVKGLYNANSYFIKGKITTHKTWMLKYKKATYTGTGNLLLSSKFENLLELAHWSCTITALNTVVIRKRTFFDFFNPSFKKMTLFPKYGITYKGEESVYFDKVLAILQPLFTSGKIFKVSITTNRLDIELRSEQSHLDILNQLLHLS